MKKIIYITSILLLLTTFNPDLIKADRKDEIDDEIEELEKEIKKSGDKKEDIEEELYEIDENMTDLEKKIIKTKEKIKKTKEKIDSLKEEITQLGDDIKKKKEEIKVKQEELEVQKERLGQTISFMYENRDTSIYEYIFGGNDLSEVLNSFDFINTISKENETIYNDIIEEEEALQDDKIILEEKQNEQEEAKKKEEDLINEQKERKSELDDMMKEFKEEEEEVQQRLDEESKKEEEAKEHIIDYIDEKEEILEKEAKEKERKEKEAREKKEKEKKESNDDDVDNKDNENTEDNNSNNKVKAKTSTQTTGKVKNGLQVPMDVGSYTVTSLYGSRTHPILGTTKTHNGIDLAAPIGTPIYAAGSGSVVYAGPASGFGNWVVISHDSGLYTVYGHMRSDMIYVSPGDSVKAGEKIAGVGSEGGSTGPHLHFEVATGKSGRSFSYVNPDSYVDIPR